MKRNIVCAGALLLTGFFMTEKAEAYRYTKCGDGKVVWSSPFGMIQNLYSIPAGGQREDSMNNAIDRWRNVRGMNDMVFLEAYGLGQTIWFVNLKNDVAVVPRSEIGGNNGLTLMLHDGCFFGGDMEWIEADVMVAGDMTFGPTGETSLATSGRMTFIHEFGHAHGLLHAQRFNHMRRVQPRPRVGGPGETVDVLPDDANGGRFLYPSGKTEVNLFATAHRRLSSSDTIVRNNAGTVTVCSKGGDSITLVATVGNNGTVDVKQTERWWVSKSDQAHGGGTQIGEWKNGTFLAGQMDTRSLTFKLPPLSTGTWFLYHGVDALGEVNESREDDNAVREGQVLQVVDC